MHQQLSPASVVRQTAGILFIVVAAVILCCDIGFGIRGNYEYNNSYLSYWSLADKASTISQKSEYIDKFVLALETAGLQGEHDAVWLTTPDNDFDQNLYALKSLQFRLHEIQNMDVSSFQYQTAIQQITAQEQGEARHMLGVFDGVWWKVHHFFLWSWVGALQVLFFAALGVGGFWIMQYDSERYLGY